MTTASHIPPRPSPHAGDSIVRRLADSSSVRTIGAGLAALLVFALLLVAKGSNPIDGYQAMWNSISRDSTAFGDVLVRTTPYLLAALAVIVPARAGMFNVGGEGQLLMGAVASYGMADAVGDSAPRAITLVLMALAAMLGGGAWASIAAGLRQWTGTNEAISTLLLNYLATLLLGWLVFGRWKDPGSTGFPRTRNFTDRQTLPLLFGRVHIGVIVAVCAAVAVWLILSRTAWGFKLGVQGGNAEAARRAGFRTGTLATSALMAGGALAGLGGMLQTSGVEGVLRPGIMSGYGFTGVLAAWMVRHHPLKAILSAFVLAAIAVGGNGLKISEGLSAASVNVLMALMLLAVLGWGGARVKEVTA